MTEASVRVGDRWVAARESVSEVPTATSVAARFHKRSWLMVFI